MERIFISYKRADREKVFLLKDKIEAAIGESCWIDMDGIESDAGFADVIINAIKQADVYLFMYSRKHSAMTDYANDWTVRELLFAQKLKKRIVFVNIDGSPLSDWFELMFGTKQQVDATSPESFNGLINDLINWLGIKQEKMPVEAHFDVFISYSRLDETIADEICAALDRANISYFIDRQDIGIGHPFAVIAKAIKECTIFLYLGSRNAYSSKYAPKEVNFAIMNKPKNTILPYLIDDTPMPDELELLLCDYNWRTKREHPVESVLINDLLRILGRDRVKPKVQNKPAEEDLYVIKLVSAGANKLLVVKGIMDSLGLNLGEAKPIVDAAPCFLRGSYSLSKANSIKRDLEAIGASVQLYMS